MVCVVIFRAGTDGYGVMPAAEYDGDRLQCCTNSTPSSHERAQYPTGQAAELPWDFRSRWHLFAAILMRAPWWWWKARPSDVYLTEYTAMIIFGPLLVIVGIGFFCWLLFTLAVFALPFFAGLTFGIWAFHTCRVASNRILLNLRGSVAICWRSTCCSQRCVPRCQAR
jgi:hypothetical protein